jgi:hypothetical protein
MKEEPVRARKRDRPRRPEAATAHAGEAGAALAGPTGPPWELSAAEWRLLVITAVGGFVSIVAGAGVIGGAIALARW